MKIKKCVSLAVLMVVLLVVSLPSSFASQNFVQTSIPRPEPDNFNKYFVVNGYLYWVSMQIDSVYRYPESIASSTQVYTNNETVNFTVQGDIQNEFPDTYFIYGLGIYDNDGNITGHISGANNTQPYLIQANGRDSAIPSAVTNLNIDGTISTKDIELKYSYVVARDISNVCDFELQLIDSTHFKLNFYPNIMLSQITGTTNLAVSVRCNVVCYDLQNEEFLHSTFYSQVFNSFTGYHLNFSFPDDIENLEVFGFPLVNENNVSFDIGGVLWGVDPQWSTWLMQQTLYLEEIWRNIVQVTSPYEANTTSSWAEDLSNGVPSNELEVQPSAQNIALNDAVDNVRLNLAGQNTIRDWVTAFSHPELIAVSVFALACGSVILVLGKKKSE